MFPLPEAIQVVERRGLIMSGAIFLVIAQGCAKDPEGVSYINGVRVETKIIINHKGEETAIPLALTPDVETFRKKLKAIVVQTFDRREDGVSPSLALHITQHPDPPAEVTKALSEKHGENAKMAWTCDITCPAYFVKELGPGRYTLLMVNTGNKTLEKVGPTDSMDLIIDETINDILLEIGNTAFWGSNEGHDSISEAYLKASGFKQKK